jgi:tRNA pseudouridine55 synthase
VNGVLVIDKPAGPTSHDVVAVARRAFRGARVGHTGTLDPLATGVLPLVIGRATRLASFMTGADKEYVARIRFGLATDTYDAEGLSGRESRQPIDSLSELAVAEALRGFVGRFQQTPPPFSAKKIGGTPAYKLARKDAVVDVKPVEVRVGSLELQSYREGLAEVRLVSSSGFYVRSLAHDVGMRLGCGAHLEGLRRTRSGQFTLEDAVSLEELATASSEGLGPRLIPMERLLLDLPSVVVTGAGAIRVSHGSDVGPADVLGPIPRVREASGDVIGGSKLRLFDEGGLLLALAEPREGGLLHPVVVLV